MSQPQANEFFSEHLAIFPVECEGYRVEEVRVAGSSTDPARGEHKQIIAPVRELEGRPQGEVIRRHKMPITRPDLYLDFIRLPASTRELQGNPNAFVGFANEWGMLNRDRVAYTRPVPGGHRICLNGELIENWMAAVRDMRRAVRVWTAISSSEEAALKGIFAYAPDQAAFGMGTWRYFFGDNLPGSGSQMSGEYGPKKLDVVSKRWLASQLDDALHDGFRLSVSWNEEQQKMETRLRPTGLLSAMWWCLSKEVTGQATFRTCQSCGKAIEISSDDTGRYRNTIFCNGACKQRDYRRNFNEARKLHAAGATLAVIAKKLSKNKGVVERWIKKFDA